MQHYAYEAPVQNILSLNPSVDLMKNKINKGKKIRIVLTDGRAASISNREFQCIKLLAHGRRIKEIARCLEISHRTVEYYLSLLKEKINCYEHEQLVDFYWTHLEPKIIDI